MTRYAKQAVAVLLTATTTWMCAAPRAEAMMAPTQTATQEAAHSARASDLTEVQSFLEQKVVRQRLHDFGLSDADVQQRLSRLSDADVHQVALRIDKQNPAGDAGGTLITVLVIGVLAALFVYLIKRV